MPVLDGWAGAARPACSLDEPPPNPDEGYNGAVRVAALLALILGTIACVACGSRDAQPASGADRDGTANATRNSTAPALGVRLSVTPDSAEIVVDGEVLGPADTVGGEDGVIRLEPGLHQLMVRADGYETWRLEVAVQDKIEEFVVQLRQK